MENTEIKSTESNQVKNDSMRLAEIMEMVKNQPNDQELGAEVREYIWQLTNS